VKAAKPKLNFRYHNPNTEEETLKFVAKLFIEISRVKFENVIQNAAVQESENRVEKELS